MRKIIIQEFTSLDGVMQAPGGPEEDESGQFAFGGWTSPYFAEADAAAGPFMDEWMKPTDLLLGRETYDIFAGYWPEHADMWPGIMDVNKYIVSTTLKQSKVDEGNWPNVRVIGSLDELKQLKETDGKDLKVHGSGKLVRSLLEAGLADELHLMTFPIVLGKGKRWYGEDSIAGSFTLMDSLVAPNGVIFANYMRAGDVQTGSVG